MRYNINYEDQNILVVDDNYNNLLTIRLILEHHKIGNIYDATTAAQAYDILSAHPIDAILLDVMMPDVDGIQACAHIRTYREYDLIPILMITGDKGDYSLKKSFDAGANDYIEKPINDVALMGRLNSQLRQRDMELCIIENSRFSAKSEITSMLAHQWRQPLSNINTMTSSIQTKLMLDKINKEETLEALKEVEYAVVNLSELINSFNMAFSSQTSTSIFDINTFIDNLLLLLQPQLDYQRIIIERKSIIQKVFELDKQSLLQVFISLMNNSIESLADSDIKDPTIMIETSYENNQLKISITDNGKGIKKEAMPYIFEPYFSTKKEINGQGLGLYMVKQLIHNNLNGEIYITSKPSQTRATITLNIED